MKDFSSKIYHEPESLVTVITNEIFLSWITNLFMEQIGFSLYKSFVSRQVSALETSAAVEMYGTKLVTLMVWVIQEEAYGVSKLARPVVIQKLFQLGSSMKLVSLEV